MNSARSYLTAIGTTFSLGAGGYILGSLTALAVFLALPQTGFITFDSSLSRNLLSIIALQGIGMPFTALVYLYTTNRPLSYIKLTKPSLVVLKFSAYGLIILFAAQLIIGNLLTFLDTPTATSAITTSPTAELPLYAILSILIIAPAEELLFRGVIQTRLRETYTKLPAILLASLIFSLPHWSAFLTENGRLTSLFVIFVLGALLGWMYERTQTLTVPIIVHGLFNATVFALNMF